MSKTKHFTPKDFKDHHLGIHTSISFRMKRPDSGFESFTVTWMPGCIYLGGDLGDLTLTHHEALSSINQAIPWLAGADYVYLMQKSGKQKTHFNALKTIDNLARLGDESLRNSGSRLENDEWRVLAALFENDDPYLVNTVAKRRQLLRTARARAAELTPHEVYVQLSDFGLDEHASGIIEMEYEPLTVTQIAALQAWAQRMIEKGLFHAPPHKLKNGTAFGPAKTS